MDQQTARDIIRQVLRKHAECRGDYDRIAHYFEGGDVYQICERLWNFCKRNFRYVEEDVEYQYTSCPITMLTGGDVDCKNYALFIAGVLDALKRRGYDLTYCYRFASYYLMDRTPHHVFVVVNPNTDNIWIDPVLDEFDYHLFYWYGRSKTPKGTARVAAIGWAPPQTIGTTAAENSLLSEVAAYQKGLIGAMQQTSTTGVFNTITQSVLLGVAIAVIPGAAIALAALKAGAIALDHAFGVGSASARLVTDISNLNVMALWNDIWGRTYNTDQYWGAVYYKFYVLGQNVTDERQVSDADVLPALKWFIDRTGVFISGREHIIALTQSPQAYMNYYGVNSDTTTDPTLVTAGYLVASTYWKNPGNFNPSLMGSWKNTVGVYDRGLVQLANQVGTSPEQLAAQTGTTEQIAQQEIATASVPKLSMTKILGLAAAAMILFYLTEK